MVVATLGSVGLAYAQNRDVNNQNDNGQGVNVAATPELDSFWLFGTGVAGLLAVLLLRHRTKRGVSK
jgi:hypothetical protein